MSNTYSYEVEVDLNTYTALAAAWESLPERCHYITENCSYTFLVEIAHTNGIVEAWEGPCSEASYFADEMPGILGHVASENGILDIADFTSMSFWFSQRADAMRFALNFGGAA